MKKKIKSAVKKLKSTRGTGKRLIQTVKANSDRKKTSKAVDAHLRKTAGAKRVIASARKTMGSKEYGPYQKLYASRLLENTKQGTSRPARIIKKSTANLKKKTKK